MENAFNRKRRKRRPKVCHFCVDKVEHIDYKEIDKLKKYNGTQQDNPPPRNGYVCEAPAPADARNQAREAYRAAALHIRLKSARISAV